MTAITLALQELSERGVTSPNEFATLAAATILDTCRWFDAQGGRIGAGMLVSALRAGGKPGWQPNQRRDLMAEQREYEHAIVDWLRRNFPDLCDPLPHPAAVVAVIRLHHVHGKGRLTAAEHGDVIRRQVASWDARWSEAAK